MKKRMDIIEVRNMFGETCFETETGFIINRFGKYLPGITFVVGKEFELDAEGKVISPIEYISGRDVIDKMNMDFDGDAEFMFGDFWRSKKGGACFRPKDPMYANDLLIRVNWGGCFNSHRGTYSDKAKAIEGVKYFRRASSNGGGVGIDYWVVPIGFSRLIHIDEIDGGAESSKVTVNKEWAKACRQKYATMLRDKSEANDKAYKAKLKAEEESRQKRDSVLPRLEEIQGELMKLKGPHKWGRYSVSIPSFGETYFEFDYQKRLYGDEQLELVEEYLKHTSKWIAETEAKRQKAFELKKFFEPRFEELRERIEALGWKMRISEDKVSVNDPTVRYGGEKEYPFSAEGIQALTERLVEEENIVAEWEARRENNERIRRVLTEVGFPKDLFDLFDNSENLDSVIRKDAEIIMAARDVEKDEMDMHELCACGFDRRCNAIYRVIDRAGGAGVSIRIDGQSGSMRLAHYLAGR